MSKIIKILLIYLISFILIANFNFIFASDIDMNLTENLTESSNEESNEESNENFIMSPVDEQETFGETTSPSSIGSISDDGLSMTNILNIILITIGILLILFAIAIIIRLK